MVYSACSRVTNLVRMGSLWAASRMASAATFAGAPLPFPIRVSAGFLVMGLSGNKRIHTLPPRLMERVMAIRAASICRSVIQAQLMALRPYSPKAMDEPRHALPHIRPRCCLRYLTFFGIIMAYFSPSGVPSVEGAVGGAVGEK